MKLISTHRQYRNVIGESPIANADYIFWVDAEASQVFRMEIRNQVVMRFNLEIPVTAIAFTSGDGFLLASKQGIYLADASFTLLRFICDPVAKLNNIRINDAVVSAKGDLWFGTMNDAELEKPDGSIYVLQRNLGKVIQFDTGFSVANGIAFSPDGKLAYAVNMFQAQVLQYELDAGGLGFTAKRVFIQLANDQGLPDGLTVDAEGNVYVCHWQGQCVTVYSPLGECIDRIALPAEHVTRCTFYGPSLSQLAVTSGSYQCDAQVLARNPDSGNLFFLNNSRQGLPDRQYQLT